MGTNATIPNCSTAMGMGVCVPTATRCVAITVSVQMSTGVGTRDNCVSMATSHVATVADVITLSITLVTTVGSFV